MKRATVIPVAYIYLDGSGIETLLAQTVDRLEIHRSSSLEMVGSGKAGVTGRLKSVVLKALGGPEIDITAEVGASRRRVDELKQEQVTEQRLAALVSRLEGFGREALFSDLGEASSRVLSAPG
jgi:glucose-6-phosphate dehydrogenase assembly protein OpcA